MVEVHSGAAPASLHIHTETVARRRLNDLVLKELNSAARPFVKLDVQGRGFADQRNGHGLQAGGIFFRPTSDETTRG